MYLLHITENSFNFKNKLTDAYYHNGSVSKRMNYKQLSIDRYMFYLPHLIESQRLLSYLQPSGTFRELAVAMLLVILTVLQTV